MFSGWQPRQIRARLLLLVLLLASVLIVSGFAGYFFCPKPQLYGYTTYSKAFLDEERRLLRLTLAEDDRYRLYQPLEGIAPDLIRATLLYEDQDFYRHPGIDVAALARAFWSTYVSGGRRVGASTITMQVARLHWRMDSSSPVGKLRQMIRALQLNRHYGKEEILEAYFNLAPYGHNIEGIAAASLIYFDKTAEQLNWLEAMTLSVIPQNPNRRNPTTRVGYDTINDARRRLYQRWREQFPEEAPDAGLLDIPLSVRNLRQLPFAAPHFVNYQLARLPRWQQGAIHTTVNLDLQRTMEQGLQTWVGQHRHEGINNAAALLVNYQTQTIKAMVGSADFFDPTIHGQVNGTLAKRSPGSALKPFVYALAMDDGLIHPMSMLRDAHKRFGGFTPENFDRRFLGPVVAKTALIESRNVPAVDLQAQLKSRSFHEFLAQAGVRGLKDERHYGLALALGGGEVTMLELATLYGLLANGGRLPRLNSLLSQANEGRNFAVSAKPLLSPEASFLVLDMLRENPPPKSHPRYFDFAYKNDIAWKTGTSWAFRDAWAVGVSGPYVLVVWVGNFDGSGNGAFVGRRTAGPLLFSLFNRVYPHRGWRLEDSINMASLNIKRVDVCAATGDLPGAACPRTVPAWFIPGVSPIKVSTVHRRIPIDNHSGLRACEHSPGKTTQKVYEFWPSDFLRLFRQAGISLKTPPPYATDCEGYDTGKRGRQPRLDSPVSGLDYVMNLRRDEQHTIPFAATVEADVETLYWFVDGDYVGSAKRDEIFYWPASSGVFAVTAVDDSGRAGSVTMTVVAVH